MPERIILDTNIWVSYFIGGKFDEIALTILNNNLTVFSSIKLEKEVNNVLSRKKFKTLLHLEVDRYLSFLYGLCPDEHDDFLFDLAIQTKSDFLVTGDKRLIAFDSSPITIISLKAFKESYPVIR